MGRDAGAGAGKAHQGGGERREGGERLPGGIGAWEASVPGVFSPPQTALCHPFPRCTLPDPFSSPLLPGVARISSSAG